MSRTFAKLVEYFGPYPYTRHALPSPGSQNLTFLQDAQQVYNPIGAGWAPTGQRGWTSGYLPPVGGTQILTGPAIEGFLHPKLIGVVGPGGYPQGQVFNPPLYDSGSYV